MRQFGKPLLSAADTSVPQWGGTAGGSANTYTITTTPVIPDLVAGLRVAFKIGAAKGNTGASTLDVGDTAARGAKALQIEGAALASGRLVAGGTYSAVYDGAAWQVSTGATGATGAAAINLTSISGTNTITATASGVTMAAGMVFSLKPAATNTGGTTNLNINGTGNVRVYRPDGVTDPLAGDLISGRSTLLVYTGSVYLIMDPGIAHPFVTQNYMAFYGFSGGSPGAGHGYVGRDGWGGIRLNNSYQAALTINDVNRFIVYDTGADLTSIGIAVAGTTFVTIKAVAVSPCLFVAHVNGVGAAILYWDGSTLSVWRGLADTNVVAAASAGAGEVAWRVSAGNLQASNNTGSSKTCYAGLAVR